MAVRAVKPKFAPNPFRRSLLAKVHLAKKELGLADDDYRQILLDTVGEDSAARCSGPDLAKLLDRFRERGWQQRPATGAKAASHPMARKARALWISLYQLGVIRNRDESALEAFGARQLGVERLQWANQAHGYKLIEALKKMAQANGWDPTVSADVPKGSETRYVMRALCEAILLKLKAEGTVPDRWTLKHTGEQLCGTSWAGLFPEVGELETLAARLGDKLRTARGGK